MSRTHRPRGRTPLVWWVLALCLVVVGASGLAAGTASAQTDPAPTAPATTAVPSTTQAPALKERVSDSEAATTRLNRIVIALVALAVVIAVATVVFWRMTRPEGRRAKAAAAAYWVDEQGAEVPLPDVDGGAAPGAPIVDPDAWTVGAAPQVAPIPVPKLSDAPDAAPSATPDPGPESVRDPALAPLPSRTPGSGPYPGRPEPQPTAEERSGPVVVVEPVSGPAPAPDGPGIGSWASQGWGDDAEATDRPDEDDGWADADDASWHR